MIVFLPVIFLIVIKEIIEDEMNSFFLSLRSDPQRKNQFPRQILSNFFKIQNLNKKKTKGDICSDMD